MPIVTFEKISFGYEGREENAIHDISLSVEEGEFIALLGRDGAGKSTLCMLLNGLIPNFVKGRLEGEILLGGEKILSPLSEGSKYSVGLALQDPEVQLFSGSVEEEVAFGPENMGLPFSEIDQRVAWAIEVMGLSSLRDKAPYALSGGQKQRLAIASALSIMPDVLVLDEPLGMLDPMGRAELLQILSSLKEDRGMTIILAEKAADEIITYCDRIALLDRGRLVAMDTPEDVLSNPEGLHSAGVTPPQLVLLSERLISEGILAGSKAFYTEERGEKALMELLPREGGRA